MPITTVRNTTIQKVPHSRYDAFVDVPDEVEVADADRWVRYAEIVVGMRHPHVHKLQLVRGVNGLLGRPAPNFWRYAIQLELTAEADDQYPELVDQVLVDVGHALRVCYAPQVGSGQLYVGLSSRRVLPQGDAACQCCPDD